MIVNIAIFCPCVDQTEYRIRTCDAQAYNPQSRVTSACTHKQTSLWDGNYCRNKRKTDRMYM